MAFNRNLPTRPSAPANGAGALLPPQPQGEHPPQPAQKFQPGPSLIELVERLQAPVDPATSRRCYSLPSTQAPLYPFSSKEWTEEQ